MYRILVCLILFLMLTGCSTGTILKIGEQTNDTTVEFSDEITDDKKIEQIKKILDRMEKTNSKESPKGYPDTVLLIKSENEEISELNTSIWFNEDYALVRNGMVDYEEKDFYKLDSHQTKKLKKLLKTN